ncbi:MAG: hypothetical protein ACXWIU_13920 [Limisphaerales bacterium]
MFITNPLFVEAFFTGPECSLKGKEPSGQGIGFSLPGMVYSVAGLERPLSGRAFSLPGTEFSLKGKGAFPAQDDFEVSKMVLPVCKKLAS